jgi:hypothetical protein
MSWKAQSQAFERISRTLSSLVSRPSGPLMSVGTDLGVSSGAGRRVNLAVAERVFRQEYGESMTSFEGLRSRFADATGQEVRRVEAELLTLCHYLQTGARELGFDAHQLDEIVEFTTVGGYIYRMAPDAPGAVTLIPHGRGPEVVFVDVSVGRQLVTRQAPLALIGRDGGLVEVTFPVARIRRK